MKRVGENMVIRAGDTILLIRYNNYKKMDFIEEHNKIAKENNYVWMLKAGRKLVKKKLDKVKNESSIVILKAPKNVGGQYYYAKIIDYQYGEREKDGFSPDYYSNLVDDEKLWQIVSLDGTWLKLGEIKPLKSEFVDSFSLLSNGKDVKEVISSTMSSTLYITSNKDIII